MPKRILSLFRNLFRKHVIERALDDELRSTLEALTQEKIEQGLSQPVARREALIEIGGIEQVKEGVRAVRAGHIVEIIAGDIRYGLRQLLRNRSFTVECPANSVPVGVRQTGMEGARNGQGQEAHA